MKMTSMEQELTFNDERFVFETVMRVRNTETDIGQQLSLESLTMLLAEACTRFFYSKGIKEINANDQGLIVDRLELEMISRVRAREELLFELGIETIMSDYSDIAIKVCRMYDGQLVAKARKRFVYYDYRANKAIPFSGYVNEVLDQSTLLTR